MGSEANDDEQLEIDDEKSEEQKKKSGKFDSSAADLEKVTDYVEEAEIQSQNISDAIRAVNIRQTKEATEKQEREKELSRVKIRKEDVDLIVQELEIARTLAERKLREHRGNVVEALVELTN